MDKEKRRIIMPGDPEWVEAQSTVRDLLKDDKIKRVEPMDSAAVRLEKRGFPWGFVEYATIPQTENTVRIVFHFKKLSQVKMKALADYLEVEITQKLKPVAFIEAGPSPLGTDGILEYRSQWDLVLFHVPKIFGTITLNGVMQIVEKFEG